MVPKNEKEQKVHSFEEKRKRRLGKVRDRGRQLTCNEANVDSILSEGESI